MEKSNQTYIRMKNLRSILNGFLLLIIFSFNSFAQLSSFELNGYAKYLFSSVKIPYFSERFSDHLIHTRINTRWYPVESISAALEARMRGFYGETVENFPNYIDQIKSKHDFVQLDYVAWNKNKSIGYVEIDRIWLDWQFKNFQTTIGRQRIAWGTSWVWNITDLFNPLSILDFDYEERPGVDAIRLQYYTGAVSKIEAAFTRGKTRGKSIAAVHAVMNKWNYDFHLLGGVKNNRWILGGAWSGDISGAGFRGEIVASAAPQKSATSINKIPRILGESLFDYDKPVFSLALSGDYTFENSFYIHTEVLFNSNGKAKNAAIHQFEAAELGMLSPSRLSMFHEFSYNFTPLIRGSIFGLFNPNDKSFVAVPSLNWSILENFDLMLIALLFDGKPLSEFGGFGKMFFIRTKYSF